MNGSVKDGFKTGQRAVSTVVGISQTVRGGVRSLTQHPGLEENKGFAEWTHGCRSKQIRML